MINKILLIILDGLPDRPIHDLGGKTPLEKANKPNLNKLAKSSILGLMHTVDIGIRPGSDVAHLAIFGYDPFTYYSGRGPFEAAGLNINLKQGDIALRGNFATVDNEMTVTDRRAGRIDNTHELIKLLNRIKVKGARIIVKKGTGHRLVLVIKGKKLSAKVSDNDPHLAGKKSLEVYSTDGKEESISTAKILNQYLSEAYQVLNNCRINSQRTQKGLPPANYIILRGAGQCMDFTPFEKKYGLKAGLRGRRAFNGEKEQKIRLIAEGVEFIDENHVNLNKCLWKLSNNTKQVV